MSENWQLRDAYRQPGFRPFAILRSMDFDVEAFGLRLSRCRKKRPAVFADKRSEASTISEFNGSATSTARIDESIWNFSFEGSYVGVAGP
jgi:hypothetical protein